MMNRYLSHGCRDLMIAFLVCVAMAGTGCENNANTTGSDGGNGGQGGDGDGSGGGQPACTESPFVSWAAISTSTQGEVLSIAKGDKGVTVLVETDDGLELVRAGGDRQLLAAPAAMSNGFSGKLFSRQDGAVCAVFVDDDADVADDLMQMACDDGQPVINTKVAPGGFFSNRISLAPVESATPGQIYLYTMAFAAITVYVGSGDTWSEQELFESSISYPGNAVRAGSQVFVSVSGTFDTPKIGADLDVDWAVNNDVKSAYATRIATDGASLFYVSDSYFAKLPIGSGGNFSMQAVPNFDGFFLALGAYKDGAWGLTSTYELVDPSTGSVDSWSIPEGSLGDLVIDDQGTLTVAVTSGDQLLVGSKCL